MTPPPVWTLLPDFLQDPFAFLDGGASYWLGLRSGELRLLERELASSNYNFVPPQPGPAEWGAKAGLCQLAGVLNRH